MEKEPVAKVPVKVPFASDVTYTVSDNFQDETINCIAVSKFSMSHEDVAKYISKSRAHVTNIIRLNDLSKFVKDQLRQNHISMGHARAVITLPHDEQSKIIREAIQRKLSVRAVENLTKPRQNNKSAQIKDVDTLALERKLTDILGAKTSIHNGKKGGTVNIRYGSVDELQGIIDKLSK